MKESEFNAIIKMYKEFLIRTQERYPFLKKHEWVIDVTPNFHEPHIDDKIVSIYCDRCEVILNNRNPHLTKRDCLEKEEENGREHTKNYT